ncbi:CLN3-domain-containing protein [Hymenopellis radicata]|nr:CLN3-domain-containing protein [Hymenopellis radicata]
MVIGRKQVAKSSKPRSLITPRDVVDARLSFRLGQNANRATERAPPSCRESFGPDLHASVSQLSLRRPAQEGMTINATIFDADEMEDETRRTLLKLGISFFLFGLINNVLYVIILSAALDLVPPSTPKGIIAFCNIAPALVVKVGWPYVLKGRIRYKKRVFGCCFLSVLGMMVVAFFDTLFMRLLGICLASFSSGMFGELTFLQLSTTYVPHQYFASGTGAAGLVGAFLWWELRSFGVRVGVGLSCFLPFVIPLTFFFLLPPSTSFISSTTSDDTDVSYPIPYAPLQTADDDGEDGSLLLIGRKHLSLSVQDKLELVKPLLLKYMLPLWDSAYFVISRSSPDQHSFLSKVIQSVRDYYPLWQLVYQTTVFFSRSSISIGIPPLRLDYFRFILVALAYESAVGFFSDESEELSITLVFLLVSLEASAAAWHSTVNVFYRINQEQPDPNATNDVERTKQEREFKIGSIGFSDSLGILMASLVAVPTEVQLCRTQVARGKTLCKGL